MLVGEILCLGNELLIGRTVNTNANYLGKRLTQLGFDVRRISTVKDDLEYATKIISQILVDAPDVLVVTGGLGPTFDDIQLNCIASALGRELSLNKEAYEFVKSKYTELNAAREKMARLPEGGKMLPNPVGSAPGVVTVADKTHIISLPGVPSEMKGIFEEHVVPLVEDLNKYNSRLFEFGVDIRGVRESDISHIIDQVRRDHGDINFKSHPKKDENGVFLGLHTYAIIEDPERVKTALEDWLGRLAKDFDFTQGPIHPVINDH